MDSWLINNLDYMDIAAEVKGESEGLDKLGATQSARAATVALPVHAADRH